MGKGPKDHLTWTQVRSPGSGMDLISCPDWDPGTVYKMQCINGAHHIGGLDSPIVWPLLLIIIDCFE